MIIIKNLMNSNKPTSNLIKLKFFFLRKTKYRVSIFFYLQKIKTTKYTHKMKRKKK